MSYVIHNKTTKTAIKKALQEKIDIIRGQLREIKLFLEYEETLAALKEIEDQDENIEGLIPEYKTIHSFSNFKESLGRTYSESWSISKKGEYVLSENKKLMTTSEIANSILLKEPGLNKTKIVSGLAAVLIGKVREEKTFFREKNNNDEWIYGLLEWKKNKAPAAMSA